MNEGLAMGSSSGPDVSRTPFVRLIADDRMLLRVHARTGSPYQPQGQGFIEQIITKGPQ